MAMVNVKFTYYDNVIKWKHFWRYWPFVRGIHRSPVDSPHKGQWRGALMFSLICTWRNDWANNREASDLRRYPGHFDVTVMIHANLVDQNLFMTSLWFVAYSDIFYSSPKGYNICLLSIVLHWTNVAEYNLLPQHSNVIEILSALPLQWNLLL